MTVCNRSGKDFASASGLNQSTEVAILTSDAKHRGITKLLPDRLLDRDIGVVVQVGRALVKNKQIRVPQLEQASREAEELTLPGTEVLGTLLDLVIEAVDAGVASWRGSPAREEVCALEHIVQPMVQTRTISKRDKPRQSARAHSASENCSKGSRLKRTVPLKRAASCGIIVKRSRSVCNGIEAMSMPSMMMRPSKASTKRKKLSASVDLPEPVRPTIATRSC